MSPTSAGPALPCSIHSLRDGLVVYSAARAQFARKCSLLGPTRLTSSTGDNKRRDPERLRRIRMLGQRSAGGYWGALAFAIACFASASVMATKSMGPPPSSVMAEATTKPARPATAVAPLTLPTFSFTFVAK